MSSCWLETSRPRNSLHADPQSERVRHVGWSECDRRVNSGCTSARPLWAHILFLQGTVEVRDLGILLLSSIAKTIMERPSFFFMWYANARYPVCCWIVWSKQLNEFESFKSYLIALILPVVIAVRSRKLPKRHRSAYTTETVNLDFSMTRTSKRKSDIVRLVLLD